MANNPDARPERLLDELELLRNFRAWLHEEACRETNADEARVAFAVARDRAAAILAEEEAAALYEDLEDEPAR